MTGIGEYVGRLESRMNYDRVTIYLRSPLFTLKDDDAHVPAKGMIVEGAIVDDKSGPVVNAIRFRDEAGKIVSEKPVTLIIPWSKIDHVKVDT